MRIIFAGTPEFAIPSLEALLSSHHKICAVYTQPDRPAGRGQKITASPIKKLALERNLQVYQLDTLKDLLVQKQLQNLTADVLINVAYGMILPEAILHMFKAGCVNVHPSLLPQWRGAAPIQRAIIVGDQVTGVSIMHMDIGLDTGGVYKQETLPIEPTDTAATLMVKAAELGAKLLLEVLAEIEVGTAKVTPQDDVLSTYAKKISKEEGRIGWYKTAHEIDRMIRAFNPWPIAYTRIDEQILRIWQAEIRSDISPQTNAPGTIIQASKNGIDVATSTEILRLLKIQLPGGKPLLVADILNAYSQMFIVGKKLQ